MLRICVAEQLLASQEGFSSMEFVSSANKRLKVCEETIPTIP
jgi:hypothetical protein